MKRCWCLLLAALLAFSAGCGATGDTVAAGSPVAMYYQTRDGGTLSGEAVILPEDRSVGVLSLREFLDLYLAGPETETLMSPFPAETRVLDIQFADEGLILKMSPAFFTLTGVKLSVASCCLTNTICEYTGRRSVVLLDETESIRLELQPGQFLLSNTLSNEGDRSFTLYFADSQFRYLIAETRDATLSRNETEAAFVMRRLMEGPENSQLNPVVPVGTELLGVSVLDGVCTVDLSYEFFKNRPRDPLQDYLIVYGITNTLTGIEGIESVRFLVDGAAVDRYGLFPLGEPLTRFPDCVGPARTASGEVDVDLYVRGGTAEFAVPCRVKQVISQPVAEALLTRLLDYEPPAGFYNPIPYGTELLGVSVSGNVCYVDLSDKFIPQEDSDQAEREAVWSLVMSLTGLSDIDSVVLTIGGESAGLQFVDISEPLTRRSARDLA